MLAMKVQQLRQRLQEIVPVRKPTGLKDRKNRPIYTGDVVRFYYDDEVGLNEEQVFYEGQEIYAEVNDLVYEFDGEFYFGCLICNDLPSAFAFRYAEYCEVIGHGVDFFLLLNKDEIVA